MNMAKLDEGLGGGAVLYGESRAALGVVGLLAHDEQNNVYLLTHATLLADAEPLSIRLSDQLEPLPPLIPHGSPDGRWLPPASSISSLIGVMKLAADVQANPLVAGLSVLGEMAEPLFPIDAARDELLLAANGSATKWSIRTIEGWAQFQTDDGSQQFYNDVVECVALEPIADEIPLGGAVFFTPSGAPVAMLIGWRGDVALAAPIRSVLWQNGWNPLSHRVAALHNKLIAPSAGELDDRPIVTLAQRPSDARSRSFRFAVLPLRPPPVATEIVGLESLKDQIQPGFYKNRTGFSATKLKRWLLNGLRRRDAATDHEGLADAFHPLRLQDADRPAREVLAAVAQIDPFKQEQLIDFAIERLEAANTQDRHEERALLWWFAHDFLARRTRGGVSVDTGERIFHALSIQHDATVRKLKAHGASRAIEDELFAMMEAMCALPPTRGRNMLLENLVKRLAFAPRWRAFAATRLLLQYVKEGYKHWAVIVQDHVDLIEWAQSSYFADRTDLLRLFELVLHDRAISMAQIDHTFTRLIGSDDTVVVDLSLAAFEMTRDREQQELKSALKSLQVFHEFA